MVLYGTAQTLFDNDTALQTFLHGECDPMPTPQLLDQVRNVARVKHFSLSTERAYVSWIRRFILFHHKRHPKEMAEAEIREFISHLAVDAKISASTQTVALSALLFL